MLKLRDQDNLKEREKLLLCKFEATIKHENKKLALLSQSHFVHTDKKLDILTEAVEGLRQKARERKKHHVLMPLRDPAVKQTLFTILKAPSPLKTSQAILAFAQFKVAFVLLYLIGCRITEIRKIIFQDIQKIRTKGIANIEQSKTGTIKQTVSKILYRN